MFVKGSDFVLDGAESSLRLAYSGVTPEEIEEGVARLAEAYRQLGRRRPKMRPEEIAAVGDLAGEAAAGTARRIHEMHAGIAGRVWSRVGPGALPGQVRPRPDRARRYSAASPPDRVDRSRRRACGQPRPRPRTHRRSQSSPAGRLLVSALNGAYGDTLVRRRNPLALRMAVRRHGRDLKLTPAEITSAYPNAKPRLAVFVHGLCETDEAWKLGAARHVPYGHRMEIELGYTPVYLRVQHRPPHLRERQRPRARSSKRSWPRGRCRSTRWS